MCYIVRFSMLVGRVLEEVEKREDIVLFGIEVRLILLILDLNSNKTKSFLESCLYPSNCTSRPSNGKKCLCFG